MWSGLVLVAILLGVLGAVLWHRGRTLQESTGLPRGQVVAADTGSWQPVSAPLVSRRHGLIGRPDYLVRVREGNQVYHIPVEVKSAPAPPEPYPGHVLQLAAYCLLVEEVHRTHPPYGILHYRDRTFRIPFTDALRRQVLATAAALRAARRASEVHRSHQDPARCRACGYRQACGDQALVP